MLSTIAHAQDISGYGMFVFNLMAYNMVLFAKQKLCIFDILSSTTIREKEINSSTQPHQYYSRNGISVVVHLNDYVLCNSNCYMRSVHTLIIFICPVAVVVMRMIQG